MKNSERLLLAVLIIGVWALVLKPSGINAHSGADVTCDISGSAWGSASGGDVEIYDFGGVSVSCTVD